MSMSRASGGVVCERARAWAALAPDGELSELERKLLGSHLARCPACAGFSVEVAAVAAELRSAAAQPLARPVALPSRHRRTAYARFRAVGAAAAVAVMAVGIASRAPLATDDRRPVPRVVDFSGGDQAELRNLRSAALAAERELRSGPALRGGSQPA